MEKELLKKAYILMAEVLSENSAVAFEGRTIDDIAETLESWSNELPKEKDGMLSINYFNLNVKMYDLENSSAKIIYDKESKSNGFLKAGNINNETGFVIKGPKGAK